MPEEVQLRLGEIADVAKEGLLAPAAGLAVLHECMEHEVCELVGPQGRHDADRTTKRHGRASSSKDGSLQNSVGSEPEDELLAAVELAKGARS